MAPRQQDSLTAPQAPARPGDPIDLHESVAGEEDPGASFDVPNDEVPPATPGTGEKVPPRSGSS